VDLSCSRIKTDDFFYEDSQTSSLNLVNFRFECPWQMALRSVEALPALAGSAVPDNRLGFEYECCHLPEVSEEGMRAFTLFVCVWWRGNSCKVNPKVPDHLIYLSTLMSPPMLPYQHDDAASPLMLHSK
jgi:hypothetical protein